MISMIKMRMEEENEGEDNEGEDNEEEEEKDNAFRTSCKECQPSFLG